MTTTYLKARALERECDELTATVKRLESCLCAAKAALEGRKAAYNATVDSGLNVRIARFYPSDIAGLPSSN